MRSRIGGWGLMNSNARATIYYFRCNSHQPTNVPLRESPRESRLDMIAHYVRMKSDPRAGRCDLDLCSDEFQYRDLST